MITILATVFLLGVMILIHELGHFWMARRVGIKVLKLSFGFPPKLFGLKRGDTEYLVQAIPLGGYVKLAGEEAFEDYYVPKPGDYMTCPWWGRTLMALAGPMANLITAFFIFFIIGAAGIRAPDYAPVVGKVTPGSLAEQLKVAEGDRIVSVGGLPVTTWHGADLAWEQAEKGTSDRIAVVLERGGRTDTVRAIQGSRAEWFKGLTPLVPAQLGDIYPNYPAYQAGLLKGDIVLSVNGQPVKTWDEMRSLVTQHIEKDVALSVLRNNDTLRITLKPVEQQTDKGKIGIIGITAPEFGSYKLRLGPLRASGSAVLTLGTSISMIYRTLFRLVTKPSTAKQLGSFLMIGQLAGESAKKGFSDLLVLMASLSIMLFVMNLLPLPVLDGGVIFFSVLEGIRKRALPVKAQSLIQQVGVGLLLAIMALAVVNDGLRIMTRWAALKSNAPAAGQKK
ncbi:MAG: RIP metalloprotease RseP [Candidatus Edwardsbacteria bacterium]|nr:RIP metalloprotease RseP [Candidatus Edwardsbacteria bacterium]